MPFFPDAKYNPHLLLHALCDWLCHVPCSPVAVYPDPIRGGENGAPTSPSRCLHAGHRHGGSQCGPVSAEVAACLLDGAAASAGDMTCAATACMQAWKVLLLRNAVLVMCDVLNPDGSPHDTNTRARLVELLTPDVVAERPLYGFEQVRCSGA